MTRIAAASSLAIKFHNQLLVDRAVNIFTRWQPRDGRHHVARCRRNPWRPPATRRCLPCAFDVSVFAASLFDGNHVARLYLERRDIDFAIVYEHVPVINELTRLAPRSRESRAIDSIVEPAFQQEQKILAGDPLHARRALEIISKLSFENKVDALDLLLLAQLLTVTSQSFAPTH